MFVDDRGRLFGRVNLIDAAIGSFVIVLIPIGYAAFMLFRTPKPVITSVERVQLTNVEERAAAGTELSGKLKVRGTGLRPALRASIGSQPAVGFIFESPTSADVVFGDTSSGVHDLILYDGVQEVARSAGAVTIPPKPSPARAHVRVVGALIDLDQTTARALRVGGKFPSSGETQVEIAALGQVVPDVRSVGQLGGGHIQLMAEGRWQRAAGIVVSCELDVPGECRLDSKPLGAGNLVIVVPGPSGAMRLYVQEVVPAIPPRLAEARVRFIGQAELLDAVKVGDIDDSIPALDDRAASILAIGGRQTVQGDVSIVMPSETAPNSLGLRATERLASFDALLRLGLDPSPSGWRYRTQLVKVGTAFTFATERYVMRGTVLSLAIRPDVNRPSASSH